MAYETIEVGVDERGVGHLTLARPESHNAMNGVMWDEGRAATRRLEEDPRVRAVVLSGRGKTFCSGGDLKYQLSQLDRPRAEKLAEAGKLAHWLRELDTLSKPLVGRINGPAYAGGLGLVSACDVAIGIEGATFCVTEARLGLVPAMISPYLVRRIGPSRARRLFLNARRFSAEEAVRHGLLDRAVPAQELDAAVEEEVELVLQCAPGAIRTIKRLIEHVSTHGHAENLPYTVERVADMWDDDEAREGLRSFVEKRRPAWAERPGWTRAGRP